MKTLDHLTPEEKHARRCEQMRAYNEKHKDRIRIYQNKYISERYKRDPVFATKLNLHSMIASACRYNGYGWGSRSKLNKIVGLTYQDFKIWILNSFQDGMIWEDRTTWHLDCILPASTAQTVAEMENRFHFKNLRALTPAQNMRMSNNREF